VIFLVWSEYHIDAISYLVTATIYEVNTPIATPDDLRTDPKLADEADRAYAQSQSGPRVVLPCSICYLPLSHFIPPKDLAALATRALSPLVDRTPRDNILASRFSPEKKLGQVEFIFDLGNWSP
jgi:hypothetical protein